MNKSEAKPSRRRRREKSQATEVAEEGVFNLEGVIPLEQVLVNLIEEDSPKRERAGETELEERLEITQL